MARTDDTTNQCPEMVAEAQREENAGEAFDDTILLMVVNDDLVRSVVIGVGMLLVYGFGLV